MAPVHQHTKEQIIWLQMKKGRENALAYLYDQYVDTLFNYGKKFTTKHEIIEDAIQDLMTELWFKREKLSLPDSVKAYLLFAFKQKITRQLSRVNKLFYTEQYTEFHVPDQDNYLSRQIKIEGNAVFQRKLIKAIENLSPKEQEAIHLRYAESMKHEDIAKIMDIRKQSLYNLLHNAVLKLSKALNDDRRTAFVYLLLTLSLIFLSFLVVL